MQARVATATDIPAIADSLAGAFAADPVWSWVFADPATRHDRLHAMWSFLLRASIEYGWVWTTPDHEAATLWIPPGQPELAEPYASRVDEEVTAIAAERTPVVLELFDRFEAAHPHVAPHYYLSLLGTRPDQRGKGVGMALLADNLARIDAEHAPAYLESTNPANLARYRGAGFADHTTFAAVTGGPLVTGMWRTAR